MIADEQLVGAFQREGHMIGAMARRRDRLDGPAVALDDLTILQTLIRHEGHVARGIERFVFTDVERPRMTVRPFGQHDGAGGCFQRRRVRRMIAMGVRDENMRDGFTLHRIENGGDVGGVFRAGIDNRDLAAPDDVAVGALEREWTGIVAQDAPHARTALDRLAGQLIESFIEWNILRGIFGHGAPATLEITKSS